MRRLALSSSCWPSPGGVRPPPPPRPAPPPVAAPARPTEALPPTALSETRQVLHLLDRLGYGPRPGDVEAVRRMGVAAWIKAQLHPERLDDRAVEGRLAGLRVPAMAPRGLMDAYPLPQTFRQQGMEVPREQSPQAMIGELQRAKVLRAASSKQQLLEVFTRLLVQSLQRIRREGELRLLPEYERAGFGRTCSADSGHAGGDGPPSRDALLLDTWLSIAPGTRRGESGRGLNENYARELLELHTLGVDGGYTQSDVIEVARAFTGWTIDPRRTPRWEAASCFDARAHDRGAKTFLGAELSLRRRPREGERVLDMLAAAPATDALRREQARPRFVSDDLPAALVERRRRSSGTADGKSGRSCGRSCVTRFLRAGARGRRSSRRSNSSASALRAIGAETDGGAARPSDAPRMGQPPTVPGAHRLRRQRGGVGQRGGLLARMNVAQALVGGRLPATTVDLGRFVPQAATHRVAGRPARRPFRG